MLQRNVAVPVMTTTTDRHMATTTNRRNKHKYRCDSGLLPFLRIYNNLDFAELVLVIVGGTHPKKNEPAGLKLTIFWF